MRKAYSGHHYLIYTFTFVIAFAISALVRIRMLGSAPTRLIQVEWNENIGAIYRDNSYGSHGYDLYIPTSAEPAANQYLILYIHGGSFNSGSKEDGDAWCKFYASKGYICATVDYSLQNHGIDAPISLMNQEIEEAVAAIYDKTEELGYHIAGMASCGVSAGGTLAMNLAYNGRSRILVKFVFRLAAPTWFDPADWGLLKKVACLKTDEEFVSMMTVDGNWKAVSPASIVNENSVPTLMGYGLKDHCVPLNQKIILMEAMDAAEAEYEYLPFPHSNHGMYNDLDVLQVFIDESLRWCEEYFN